MKTTKAEVFFCFVSCFFISVGSCLFETASSALLGNGDRSFIYLMVLVLSLFFCFAPGCILKRIPPCSKGHFLFLCGMVSIISIICSEILESFFKQDTLTYPARFFRICYISVAAIFLFQRQSKKVASGS